MCNGYVLVDYDKNIPDVADDGGTLNDNTYGLWDLKSSFTIEAIVTLLEQCHILLVLIIKVIVT